MNCPTCNEPLRFSGHETRTLVGYIGGGDGHNHDDNCVTRGYRCARGHRVAVSIRRRCGKPGCGWVGKATCFCHEGAKVDEWPGAEAPAPGAKGVEDV